MNTLNIEAAKVKSCVDVMHHFGHTPIAEFGNGELLYISPFRNEKSPSFYVNVNKNSFYDHGDSMYRGDVIQLYRFFTGRTFYNAVRDLSGELTIIARHEVLPGRVKEPGMKIKKIAREITNPALTYYARSRGISKMILNTYCDEILYQQSNGRVYRSIGFENAEGGYELRSAGFKACYGKKSHTVFKGSDSEVVLLEGFFDFLSFKELFGTETKPTVIVLNSLSQLSKVDLFTYDMIYSLLDRDPAGVKTFNSLKDKYKTVLDYSRIYTGFNDLNDYLISKDEYKKQNITHR